MNKKTKFYLHSLAQDSGCNDLFFCLIKYLHSEPRLVVRDSLHDLKARVRDLRSNDVNSMIAYRLDIATNVRHYFDMYALLAEKY